MEEEKKEGNNERKTNFKEEKNRNEPQKLIS